MADLSDYSSCSSVASSPYQSDEDAVIQSFITSQAEAAPSTSQMQESTNYCSKYKDHACLKSFKISNKSGPHLFPRRSEETSSELLDTVIDRLEESYKTAFIYINMPLVIELGLSQPMRVPQGLMCDAFVVSPFKPVGIFTFLLQDSASDFDACLAYNTSIARAFTSSVRRDGLTRFIPVHGAFDFATYSNSDSFSKEIQLLEKRAYTIGMKSSVDLGKMSSDSAIQIFVNLLFTSSSAAVAMETFCKTGNLKLVKDIICVSPETVNALFQNGFSPLMLACHGGHYEVVKFLLSLKGNVNISNSRGETSLILACNKALLHKTLDREEEGNIRQLGCILAHDLQAGKEMSKSTRIFKNIVELLLSHGADENAVDNDDFTPLHLTCIFGDLEVTELLLSRGVNVNYTGKLGSTALMWACMFGHDNIVDKLIQAGADVNIRANLDISALSVVAYVGNMKVGAKLLSYGANVDEIDSRKRTPLFYASWFGFPKLANLLISHNAKTDITDFFGYTLVIAASATAHTELARLMISQGADINCQDRDSRNALMWSSFSGHNDTVRLLLSHHAEVNRCDVDGRTALMWACVGGWDDVVELLLANGADVNIADNNGDTPLAYVSRNVQNIYEWIFPDGTDSFTKIFGCFIANICKPKSFEKAMNQLKHLCSDKWQSFMIGFAQLSGSTELLSALQRVFSNEHTDSPTELREDSTTRHDRVMKMLLCHGASVTCANKKGLTPLMEACSEGYENGAKMLLQNSAEVNVCNMYGDTALLIASREGYYAIVDLLLFHKAQIDVAGSDGDTPLTEASKEGHDMVVEILLTHGADVTITNNEGKTSLMLAEEGGHGRVVDVLLKHQADNYTGEPISSALQGPLIRTALQRQTGVASLEEKVTNQEDGSSVNRGSNKESSKKKKGDKKGRSEDRKGGGLFLFKSKKAHKARELFSRNLCKVS